MGRRFDKKGKNKKKATRESEASQRLTYLWGAAHVLSASAPQLSAFYVKCIRQVGRRVTLGLDAVTVKRWACKRCSALLVPGAGAAVRVSPRRETHVVVSCTACRSVRRYLARPPPAPGGGEGEERGTGAAGEEAGRGAEAPAAQPSDERGRPA